LDAPLRPLPTWNGGAKEWATIRKKNKFGYMNSVGDWDRKMGWMMTGTSVATLER
jgi:hypothetical protein